MGRSWARRVSAHTLVLLLATTLTGCGSRLDPDDVAASNGAAGGSAGVPADPVPGSQASGVRLPSGAAAPATGADPARGAGGATTGGHDAATGPAAGAGPDPAGPDAAGDPATHAMHVASCDGFRNSTGITDSEITIGNASDISGPVPGIFESAREAVQAYLAYFNSTSDICGRKLELATYDSRTDAGADEQSYATACDDVFAMVGSMSAFDSGGAQTAQSCGLPDLRAMMVTAERRSCTTCFAATAAKAGQISDALPQFVLKNYGDAAQHAGMIYVDALSSAQDAHDQVEVMTAQGMHFDVVQSFDVSEFNYAPYVQQLKDRGVRVVVFVGAPQQSILLRRAMQQQGYEPDLYLRDASDYTPEFVAGGGDAVQGTVVSLSFVPFEEASSNREMSLYLSWLHQVDPNAEPTFYGVYAWSAARLFVEKATGLGGRLSRSTLLDALRSTTKWTDNGMHAPEEVGSGDIGRGCLRFLELSGSAWRPVGGTKYSCPGGSQA